MSDQPLKWDITKGQSIISVFLKLVIKVKKSHLQVVFLIMVLFKIHISYYMDQFQDLPSD